MTEPSLLHEDAHVTVRTVPGCTIPGYVIVRPVRNVSSWADLTADEAAALGLRLRAVIGAVEAETGADRVYTLVFAEVDRRLHVHLFPRTDWLLAAYHRVTGAHAQPTNGAALFEWARTVYVVGGPPIPVDKDRVERALRDRLAFHPAGK